ncbi:MAG: hypothetical protein JJU46_03440 [Balneolaceae bacterium]|nr:hypothetical protein [Balneolaceae bacterium]MCH8548789.1 TolB-like 6-bladed beta-propeller domain-containing protein [Balneolaceae bacterium]
MIDHSDLSELEQAGFIDGEELFIANAVGIFNVGDRYIMVSDDQDDRLFHLFDSAELKYLYSWGSRGSGPDEFPFTPIRQINSMAERVYIYEIGSREMRVFEITDSTLLEIERFTLELDGQVEPLNNLTLINEELFVSDTDLSVETGETEYVMIAPNDSEPLKEFGAFPESDLTGLERAFRYFKTTRASPDGKRFVSAYLYDNLIKIYTTEGELEREIMISDSGLDNPSGEPGEYQYRVVEHVTDNYIYARGIRADRDQLAENPDISRPTIEIWNWEGELVYHAAFNLPVSRFTVSEKNGTIYATTHMDSEGIYLYDLPLLGD